MATKKEIVERIVQLYEKTKMTVPQFQKEVETMLEGLESQTEDRFDLAFSAGYDEGYNEGADSVYQRLP